MKALECRESSYKKKKLLSKIQNVNPLIIIIIKGS